MPKHTRFKTDDARKLGATVRRQIESSEVGFRLGGRLQVKRPLAELWLPANGRDIAGSGARIFDPVRCAALQAAGVPRHEALSQSEMSPAEIAAHNAAADPDDDVGDEPPRFDDETAAPSMEEGAEPRNAAPNSDKGAA